MKRDTKNDIKFGDTRGGGKLTKQNLKARKQFHNRFMKESRELRFWTLLKSAYPSLSESTYRDFKKDFTRGGDETLNKIRQFLDDNK